MADIPEIRHRLLEDRERLNRQAFNYTKLGESLSREGSFLQSQDFIDKGRACHEQIKIIEEKLDRINQMGHQKMKSMFDTRPLTGDLTMDDYGRTVNDPGRSFRQAQAFSDKPKIATKYYSGENVVWSEHDCDWRFKQSSERHEQPISFPPAPSNYKGLAKLRADHDIWCRGVLEKYK